MKPYCPHCHACGRPLNQAEARYYHNHCEQCTQDNHDRLGAWLAGNPDPELDKRYGDPNPERLREMALLHNGRVYRLPVAPGSWRVH